MSGIYVDHGSSHINQQCEIQLRGEWVTKRIRECNKHISRMKPDRIVRILRENFPKGRRGPGRSRKGWKGSLLIETG